MVKGFSTGFDTESTACARGKDLRCSPKASRNIVRRIKGMRVGEAKEFLEEVKALKTPVPMLVRNHKVHHKRGGIGPGGYPVKAADRILTVLVNAENNAEYKGLETDDLRIIHATAYLGQTFFRFKPRAQGRATPFNEQATNVEIILGKSEELDALAERKAERAGRPRARKAPAKPAEKAPEQPAAEKEPKAAPDAKKAPAKKAPATKKPAAKPKTGGTKAKTTESKKKEA